MPGMKGSHGGYQADLRLSLRQVVCEPMFEIAARMDQERLRHLVTYLKYAADTGVATNSALSSNRLIFAARIGSTRPSVTARLSVARAKATYEARVWGEFAAISLR